MLTEKTKRILIIILFLTFVFFIGFLLYFVFFRSIKENIETANEQPTQNLLGKFDQTGEITTEQDTEQTQEPDGLPSFESTQQEITTTKTATGGITETQQLTTDGIDNIQLHQNGKDLTYYDKNDGKLYLMDENGNLQKMSEKTFFNVDKVNWSPTSDKAILEYPDGSNIMFDIKTQKQVTLPKNWEEFNFNKTGSEIAFKELSDNADLNWLSIANPDGSEKTSIEHMGINFEETTVSYSPNNQIIGYYLEPSGVNTTTAYFVSKNKENLKAALLTGFGVQTQWTENGDKLIYSAYSADTDYIPELWIVEAQGDNIGRNRINLGLKTSADKCTIANQTTVYCAVPQTATYGMGLEPAVDAEVPDDIYKIDLNTGLKTKVGTTDINANIKKLMVNKTNDTLFLIDTQNNNLHKMKL